MGSFVVDITTWAMGHEGGRGCVGAQWLGLRSCCTTRGIPIWCHMGVPQRQVVRQGCEIDYIARWDAAEPFSAAAEAKFLVS